MLKRQEAKENMATYYKGYGPGMICRGKKYEEGHIYEEERAEVCECGMHYCKNPFDVLDYYDIVNKDGDFNDFSAVEPLAESLTDNGKKFCTRKLKIGAKLSVSGFIKACVDFVIEKTTEESGMDTTAARNAQIGSSGDSAQIGSSGDYAKIGSSGDYAKIGSSGDSAQIGSSGYYAVIMCAGRCSKAKAKKGSFITLAEWKQRDDGRWIPAHVLTKQVDGEEIKEDTFYMLKDGEFVEVEDE